MTTGPNLGLIDYTTQGAAWFTAAKALLRGLDGLVMPSVKDKDLTAPPGGESNGDRYIVGAGATGAWSGHAKDIARYQTSDVEGGAGWDFFTPNEGWTVYVQDEDTYYRYDGSAWGVLPYVTSAGNVIEGVCCGRLTLESGVAISTTDQTAKTTIYWTPYKGSKIALYNGATWDIVTFAETSLALGTLTAFTNYDVFGYNNAGTLTLEALAWLNATVTITIASPGVVSWTAHGMSNGDPIVFTTTGALPTGLSANTLYYVVNKNANDFQVSATFGGAAINTSGSQSGTHTAWQSRQRGTALAQQDGVLTKSGAATRRYLGTFRTTSTTTTEDSGGGSTTQVGGKRFVWNYYNRCRRFLRVIDTTANWSYTTDTWRQANAATGNKVEYVCGVDEDGIDGVLSAGWDGISNTVNSGKVTIGLDSVTTPGRYIAEGFNSGAATVFQTLTTPHAEPAGVGYHFLAWMERGVGGTSIFLGSNNNMQSGLAAWILG